MNTPNSDATSEFLAEIANLDRTALAQRWIGVIGCPPPKNCQVMLLRNVLAWQHQMKELGQRGPSATRDIARRLQWAAGSDRVSPASGTRLVREWQGKAHHVTVLAEGFDYGGKTYRSLSAIARVITGSAWSGPVFFGLR